MKAELIINQAEMDDLMATIANDSIVTVDTEFFRETSYYPHLGLVQLASNNTVACIDTLAFDASDSLKMLFLNHECTKVFHSCSQDIEVLVHSYEFTPEPIHDTQVAHALLSNHDQIGYANLVEAELGVQLPKTQTRTNWLQRPLSPQQIEYAGDDVYYLYPLYHQLLEKLERQDRLNWFEEDCQRLGSQALMPLNGDTGSLWKRVKGSRKCHGETLAIIQAIAEWREEIAIETDTTRRRVLHDERIMQLALKPPRERKDLDHLSDNRFRLTTKYLDKLFETIDTTRSMPAENWPENNSQRLSDEQNHQLKQLQGLINKQAESLGISPGMLCTRKDIESIIKGNLELPVFKGWRLEVIGRRLQEHLP